MNRHVIDIEGLKGMAKFRFATLDDVPELMMLYRKFYSEAVYKDFLEWDDERADFTIQSGIASDKRPHILAFVGDKMVGFIAYIFDHSFSVKPCQVMMELYVLPGYRKSALGRGLVGLSIMEGQRHGAGAFHAPVASGMTEAKTLFNLFSKAGFEQFGFMLRRKL